MIMRPEFRGWLKVTLVIPAMSACCTEPTGRRARTQITLDFQYRSALHATQQDFAITSALADYLLDVEQIGATLVLSNDSLGGTAEWIFSWNRCAAAGRPASPRHDS